MNLKSILTTLIASSVILGFIWLYWPLILNRGEASGSELTGFNLYVATTLAGVVGGVTAMFFQQNYQQIAQQADAAAPGTPPAGNNTLLAAVATVAPGSDSGYVNILKACYVIAYLGTGIGALVYILKHQDQAKDLKVLSNLGMTSLGLIVAVAKSVF